MSGDLERTVLELDSKKKVREFMLGSLENTDYVYNYLTRGISEIDRGDLDKHKKDRVRKLLIERTDLFEDVALTLIFENLSTPNKFVATSLISILCESDNQSPNIASGKLAEMVMRRIEYGEILRGDIRFGDKRYEYNAHLLGLLFSIQTKNIPGLEYWKSFQENEDFINFAYHALKKASDPSARQLISRIVATHHKNYGKHPRKDVALGPNFWLHELIKKEFGDAYSKFLGDPSNEYGTTIRAMTDTPVHAPDVAKTIKGNVLLLTSYKSVKGAAEIGLVYIDDKIHEYSIKIDPKNPEFGKALPSELHSPLAKIVVGFEKFRTQYLTHLATVKAKK